MIQRIPVFIGLIGAALLGDGAWLMAIDKINFGTVLPAIIGAVLLIWAFNRSAWATWVNQSLVRSVEWRWLVIGFMAWALSVLAFFAWLAVHTPTAPVTAPSVIVSLGGGLLNNKPQPSVVARLDATLAMAQRYPAALVITSGGMGNGQTVSEARAMGDYLLANGLAPQRLVIEERSTSTHENFAFVKPLLAPNAPILIVSSDFHLPRAKKIAERAQLNVAGVWPAPTPLNVRYNAWLREYFAFISGWLLNEY
jgi:uncharacterized SAM-binding protein YcdF (DUF218 family)